MINFHNKYWKVLRYNINHEYNKRYPLHAIVLINEETEEERCFEHFWMLPEACIDSKDYDWTDAVETDNIFKG